MTSPVPAPAYVHRLLDSLLNGAPLHFRNQPVPADVQDRIMKARRARLESGPKPPQTPAGPPAAAPSSAPATPALPPSSKGSRGTDHSLVSDKRALTNREWQVLKGIADGLSNADIGRMLYVSEDTIKTHARRLFRKLDARDRAHAVAIGFRRGLLRPEDMPDLGDTLCSAQCGLPYVEQSCVVHGRRS
ncbi:regulatory protein, luxR family [Paractinoplanes atraurantiacus]|uniref:Regulatory protein, luxR family n=1 Tax=Paractinoplanes atraurantiacus TaxID=1036182 RepID=A0A285GZG6_9ACTN|nr:regulatory protein, luxR family [Actinoplanes atraurantiacus]